MARNPRKPGQRVVNIAVDDIKATIDVELIMGKKKGEITMELVREIVEKEVKKHDKHKA